MINLIPTEEKKRKVRDFYFRFFVLFLFILGCSFVFASIILFPSYLLSSTKKNIISEKLIIQDPSSSLSVDKQVSSQVTTLNNELTLIENAEKNKYYVSEKIIKEIISKKMSDIKINQISYQNDPILGKSLIIYGIAPSRERLLLFRQALEGDVFFSKVDLPISNFIKGSDISFNFSLVPSL